MRGAECFEDRMNLTGWIVILVMIGLNAFFAAYEIALASISTGRLKALADEHRTGAKAALLMKQNVEASLAVVQLGLTLCTAIAGADGRGHAEEFISPMLQEKFGLSSGLADFLSVVLVVILSIVH